MEIFNCSYTFLFLEQPMNESENNQANNQTNNLSSISGSIDETLHIQIIKNQQFVKEVPSKYPHSDFDFHNQKKNFEFLNLKKIMKKEI